MFPILDSRPNRSLRRERRSPGLLIYALAGCALLLGASDLAAQSRHRVDLEYLDCHEESDEHGSDDPYLVMTGVNLRTGHSRTTTRCFRNVSSGNGRRVEAGRGIAFDDLLDEPADGVVFAALLEFDGSFGVGQIIVDDQFHVAATARVRDAMAATATKYHIAYQQGVFTRQAVIGELNDSFRQAIASAQGGHELLGIGRFDLSAGPSMPSLRMTGDGSHYTAIFRTQVFEPRKKQGQAGQPASMLQVTGVLQADLTRMLRVRLRDARNGKALPVEADVLRNGQLAHQSSAPESSWIETSLPQGGYRLVVRTPRPGYEVLEQDLTIADQDVNLTLSLQRKRKGKQKGSAGSGSKAPGAKVAGGPAVPGGMIRWTYALTPNVEYRMASGRPDRWQELKDGVVQHTFRTIPPAGPFLALKDEVRPIWLRLHPGHSEISDDGVHFRPWFPGAWH